MSDATWPSIMSEAEREMLGRLSEEHERNSALQGQLNAALARAEAAEAKWAAAIAELRGIVAANAATDSGGTYWDLCNWLSAVSTGLAFLPQTALAAENEALKAQLAAVPVGAIARILRDTPIRNAHADDHEVVLAWLDNALEAQP